MSNRLVIITGASAGIGYATAQYLADGGYQVMACARSATCDLEGHERIHYQRCDITSARDVAVLEKSVTAWMHQHGPVTFLALVNNVGLSQISPLETATREHFDTMFTTNVYAPLHVVQTLLPRMKEVPSRIVNVSSGAGVLATPLFGVYSMSKFALEAMSDVMRVEFRQFGIDTVVVQPGLINSSIHDKNLASLNSLDPATRVAYEIPIRRSVEGMSNDAKEASSPLEVAAVIREALEASRPRARYGAGRDARQLRRIHWLLTDRLRDKLQIKRGGW